MTASTISPDTARGAIRRVMYIDDEAALVQLTIRMLQRLGHCVAGFTRAEDALEVFRADPRSVDMVVTDLNMPGMSGLDVARALLSIRADTFIVLTSGYVDASLLENSRRLGIQAVVYKTNKAKEFCEQLDCLLRRSMEGGSSSGNGPIS